MPYDLYFFVERQPPPPATAAATAALPAATATRWSLVPNSIACALCDGDGVSVVWSTGDDGGDGGCTNAPIPLAHAFPPLGATQTTQPNVQTPAAVVPTPSANKLSAVVYCLAGIFSASNSSAAPIASPHARLPFELIASYAVRACELCGGSGAVLHADWWSERNDVLLAVLGAPIPLYQSIKDVWPCTIGLPPDCSRYVRRRRALCDARLTGGVTTFLKSHAPTAMAVTTHHPANERSFDQPLKSSTAARRQRSDSGDADTAAADVKSSVAAPSPSPQIFGCFGHRSILLRDVLAFDWQSCIRAVAEYGAGAGVTHVRRNERTINGIRRFRTMIETDIRRACNSVHGSSRSSDDWDPSRIRLVYWFDFLYD